MTLLLSLGLAVPVALVTQVSVDMFHPEYRGMWARVACRAGRIAGMVLEAWVRA